LYAISSAIRPLSHTSLLLILYVKQNPHSNH
jgi:hypothetical protein